MPSSTSSSKRSRWPSLFLAWYGACIACILGAVILLNATADPYGLYGHEGRPLTQYHLRLWKPWHIGHMDTIILGSSRVLDGIRPVDFPPEAGQVFNYGIGGETLWEEEAYLKYAWYMNGIHEALLTIDPFALNAGKPSNSDFMPQRLHSKNYPVRLRYWNDAITTLVSLSAITNSMHTLRGQVAGMEMVRSDGFADTPGWTQIVARNGYEEEFEKEQNDYIGTTWWDSDGQFSFQKKGESAFRTYRDMIDFAIGHHIRLTIAFSPVHARFLCTLYGAGLWDRLETAKKMLLEITEQEAAAHHTDAFAVWDFADFSEPTQEPVPEKQGTMMRYYRESSHYTPTLGRMMLDRMYRGAGGPFGTRLVDGSLERHLSDVRRRRDNYIADHRTFYDNVQKRIIALCPCRKFLTGTTQRVGERQGGACPGRHEKGAKTGPFPEKC